MFLLFLLGILFFAYWYWKKNTKLKSIEIPTSKKEFNDKAKTINPLKAEIDWKHSKAHLELLKDFHFGRDIRDYQNANYWKAILKESPLITINKFISQGVLIPTTLNKKIEFHSTVNELKIMLRERGLKISGRKNELIARLIENNEQEMDDLYRIYEMYSWSEDVSIIVQNYIEEQKNIKQTTKNSVKKFLEKKDFKQAIKTVLEYESQDVFLQEPNKSMFNIRGDEEEILSFIFEAIPPIFNNIQLNDIHFIRVCTGMMYFFGENTVRKLLPKDFINGSHFSNDVVCRMFLFNARNLQKLKEYKKFGLKEIKVLGTNDDLTCSECKKISGKTYLIDNAPQFPYHACTCEMGCRCEPLPITDYR